MGANDACAPDPTGMTPVADFRASLHSALRTYFRGRPSGLVLVSSIPSLMRVWQLGRTNATAVWIWQTAHAQSLDHLLPKSPEGKVERELALQESRERSYGEDAMLLDLASELWLAPGTSKPAAMSKDETDEAIRQYVAGRGPYAGRKGAAFKGKRHERERPAREASIAEKLAGMPTRIAAYKAERAKGRNVGRDKHPY